MKFEYAVLTTSLDHFIPMYVHYIGDVYTTYYNIMASYSSSVVMGAAVGGFIGGVLVTAAIAGCLAAAVFCRGKKGLTTVTKVT